MSVKENVTKSWQTTVVGFIGGLMLILPQIVAMLDGDPETVFSMEKFLLGLGIVTGGAVCPMPGRKNS